MQFAFLHMIGENGYLVLNINQKICPVEHMGNYTPSILYWYHVAYLPS